jgi:ferric-dicitrate binding protein FerR (iron transport regulator)
MIFKIHKDLASVAFVRCVSPIPGSDFHAEGTSFFVDRAIEKCRSEVVEGRFQLAHPLRNKMAGIAAHPDRSASVENAWNEAIETLVLEALRDKPVFRGTAMSIAGIRMYVGRVNDRFVALAIFIHNGVPTVTQSVGRNVLKTILKAWGEVRNVRIYDPSAARLATYTKANRIMTGDQILRIASIPFGANFVDTNRLRKFQHQEDQHIITYFIQEAS